jgi:hypothetical protein
LPSELNHIISKSGVALLIDVEMCR